MLLFVSLMTWPGATRLALRRPASRGAATAVNAPAAPDPGAQTLLQVIDAVTAQLRGGAAAGVAWDAAVEVLGHPVALTGSNSLPEAIGRLGARERDAASVAAAWTLAEQVGAPLAELLERLGASLRQEADVEAQLQAALAGPRATVRLLSVLPLVGVALGELIGARPVQVLVGTPAGRLSGLAGLTLAVLAHLWTRRLVARVAQP